MVLHAPDAAFEADIIDPEFAVQDGDQVQLGGFPTEALRSSDIEYEEMTPYVVEGVVRRPPFVPRFYEKLVAFEVPWGDYHGFSGGPVASVGKDGKVHVWGVLTRCFAYRFLGGEGREFLYAARLKRPNIAAANAATKCYAGDDLT